MTGKSVLFFPLRGNASALIAGAGVASVRRRILLAGLITDHVILEDGLFVAWAGAQGAASFVAHSVGGRQPKWQSPGARGRSTGSRHWLTMRPSSAPADAPSEVAISTNAVYSWDATLEPFRKELPRSAAKWLSFGHLVDDSPVKALVDGWKDSDRHARLARYGLTPPSLSPEDRIAQDTVLEAGYYDLGTAAATGAAVSLDRRHVQAINARIESGDARPLGGAYAFEVLLPADIGWEDVAELRRSRALKDYRAILREVEAAALSTLDEGGLDERIRTEYSRQLVRAASRGPAFSTRAVVAGVGFVAGTAAGPFGPLASAAVSAAGFGASEAISRARQPRWLAIDRRLNGRRNGL